MNNNNIFNVNTDTISLSHVGLIRKENEDNLGYAQTPNGHVFVVCDGMGGHVGGKEASKTAVEAIMEFFMKNQFIDIPKGMEQAIKYANKKVYEKSLHNPHLRGMGTTIVMAVINNDKIYIGHVGDSRIYLFSDNKLIQLTKDHSFVQNLYEMGIISKRDMRTHARKNEITKALGLHPNVEPDIIQKPLLLKNGDVLLLCSDGLTDMVEDELIQKILMEKKNIKEAAHALMNAALNGGGKDNISFQLIKITNSPHKQTYYPANNIHDDITLIGKKNEFSFTSAIRKKNKKFLGIKYKHWNLIAGMTIILILISVIWLPISYYSVSQKNTVKIHEEEILETTEQTIKHSKEEKENKSKNQNDNFHPKKNKLSISKKESKKVENFEKNAKAEQLPVFPGMKKKDTVVKENITQKSKVKNEK